MQSRFDTASMLLLITFSSYLFEDHFSIFPLFQSAEKSAFSNFLELGTFYASGHQNHSEQVQKRWFRFLVDFEQLFLFSEKKKIFPIFDSTFWWEKI